MLYLNQKMKIIHRDLKTDNIFMENHDGKLQAKIGDFGLSLNQVNNFFPHIFDIGCNTCRVNLKNIIEKELIFCH